MSLSHTSDNEMIMMPLYSHYKSYHTHCLIILLISIQKKLFKKGYNMNISLPCRPGARAPAVLIRAAWPGRSMYISVIQWDRDDRVFKS